MPIYLSGYSDEATCQAAETYLYGRLGIMLGPATYGGPGSKDDYRQHIPRYAAWACDNGCFTNHGAFDEDRWLGHISNILNNVDSARESCRFAVAPDVYYSDQQRGDQLATIERSRPVLREIRRLGIPAALVIQDGMHDIPLDKFPWREFDVAFIGGSDALKLGDPYDRHGTSYRYDRRRPSSIRWAEFLFRVHQEGKGLHVGRVSSNLRHHLAREIWADSTDGTYIRFRGVQRGLADIDQWTKPELDNQPVAL